MASKEKSLMFCTDFCDDGEVRILWSDRKDPKECFQDIVPQYSDIKYEIHVRTWLGQRHGSLVEVSFFATGNKQSGEYFFSDPVLKNLFNDLAFFCRTLAGVKKVKLDSDSDEDELEKDPEQRWGYHRRIEMLLDSASLWSLDLFMANTVMCAVGSFLLLYLQDIPYVLQNSIPFTKRMFV